MRRREFIACLWLAAMVGCVHAQQPAKQYRVAIVSPANPVSVMSETGPLRPYRAFFEELRRLGYVEGQNLQIERYSAEGRSDQYADLARNIIRTNPDLIFAFTNELVLDFKSATSTIPIVAMTGDPIAVGIVPSLARPGGNITGVSVDAGLGTIWGKRLGLLREAVPHASRLGFLVPRRGWGGPLGPAVQELARRAGIALITPPFDAPFTEAEYRRVFAAMKQQRADSLMVSGDSVHLTNRQVIVELANESGLPAIYPFREHVEIGGFIGYAFDLPELYRRCANVIDQILKGARPGDIPIYQVTKFELVINLKTAKALGLTVPLTLLVAADEVIE